MNIGWITIRDLEYLVSLGDLQHFGKAALACHVSQPALSNQIKKIEEQLGLMLFERTNRKVLLTDVGRVAVAQARVMLDEASKFANLSTTKTGEPQGRLILGAIATLGPYYIPHILGPIRKKFPKLELILHEGLTDGLIDDLRAGRVDAVLASPTFSDEGLLKHSLFFEPFVLAAPKEHSILKKSKIAPHDLKAAEMVLLEDGHCLKDQTLGFCPTNRRGNIRHFHATSIETMRHLIAAGVGYSLVPELARPESPNALSKLVEYREFEPADQKRVGREIALYSRLRFGRAAEIEKIVGVLHRCIPNSCFGLAG